MVGQNQTAEVKKWSRDNLSAIDRVYVENQDPISKTAAGRLMMADNLLQHDKLADAQEYSTVVETGRLPEINKRSNSQRTYIREENEVLMNGGACRVLATDIHPLHINSHSDLLDDHDFRQKAAIPGSPESIKMQNILMHIQEHKNIEAGMQQAQVQDQMALQQNQTMPQQQAA